MARQNSCKPGVTCQNDECSFFLKERGKHIVKKGVNRTGHQMCLCRHCDTCFVETSNTPLFHKHMSPGEIELIGKLANEKMGIRAIERVTGHHRDTVSMILKELASHVEFIGGLHATGLNPETNTDIPICHPLKETGGSRIAIDRKERLNVENDP